MAKAKAKKSFSVSAADAKAVFIGLGFAKKAIEGWNLDRLTQKVNKLPQMIEDGKKIADKKVNKILQAILAAKEDGLDVVVEDDAPAAKGKGGKPAPAAKGKKGGKGKAAAEEDDEDDEEEDEEDEDSEDDDEDSDDDSDDDDSDDDEEDEDSDDEGDDDEEDEDDDSDDEEDSDEDDEDSDDGDDEDDADEDDDESEEDEDEDSDDDTDEEDDDVPATKSKKKTAAKGKAGKGDGQKKPGVIQAIIGCLEAASEQKPVSKKGILKVLAKKFPDREESAMETTINVQLPNRLKAEKGLNIQKNEKGYWIGKGKPKASKPAGKKKGK